MGIAKEDGSGVLPQHFSDKSNYGVMSSSSPK